MKQLTLTALIAFSVGSFTHAETKNFESEGNLESKASIETMEIQGISSKNTPADIFRLVETKIKKKEYDEAAMAFIVAMSYGQYDAKRVENKTAHQAVAVLRMNTFNNLKEQEIQSFQTILGTIINENELITKTLEELGKPDYYPKYMIQH